MGQVKAEPLPYIQPMLLLTRQSTGDHKQKETEEAHVCALHRVRYAALYGACIMTVILCGIIFTIQPLAMTNDPSPGEASKMLLVTN
jgi:hypothetical protein